MKQKMACVETRSRGRKCLGRVDYFDCITGLINRDFDHKPWNKSQEFDMHITPEKNMLERLTA